MSTTHQGPTFEKDAVYLDYNATTPLDIAVRDTMTDVMDILWGNPSSNHRIGKRAKHCIDESRKLVALMVDIPEVDNVFFTSCGTEANNLAIHSAVTNRLDLERKKPHVITSSVEHDSVMKYLEHLEKQGSIELSIVPVNRFNCTENVISLIKDTTCLVTVMHANNETGIIMPIRDIADKLKSVNTNRLAQRLPHIYLHTDAAQTVGKVMLSMTALGVDYLTVVGHKFHGPRIGALCISSKEVPMVPLFYGGGQEKSYRPGTENTVMIAGLGKACEQVNKHIATYETHLYEMRNKLRNGLVKNIPGVKINFENDAVESKDDTRLPNTLSVAVPTGRTGFEVLNECSNSFYASLGAACHSSSSEYVPSKILLASGLTEDEARRTIRFSVGRNTTPDDIDIAVNAMSVACIL